MTSTDTTPVNDLDDIYINRYAGRVADETEVLMRADFDRVEDLRKAAWRTDDPYLRYATFAQADEIRTGWEQREDEFGAAWWELTDAVHYWTSEPDSMAVALERATVGRSQGQHTMSGLQWRNQMHARELTGHGQWTAGADFSRFDGTTTVPPRSSDPADPTNPNHYPHCSTWAEQVMRADFARIHLIREEMANPGPGTDLRTQRVQAGEIRARWETRDDEIGEQWITLNSLAGWYAESPESLDEATAMVKRARVDNLAGVSAPYVRSLDQVRELLSNPGPHSTAWEQQAATMSGSVPYPVSTAAASARTRELTGASALAGLGGNAFGAATERDGAER
ncbi:hypothetical protein ACFVMC_32980 [Nocardia sp. NPDC127579]|uniref:hypothetical protein n=1 Tax=Nocardia sp. NPDC127579 TaxID=3345402 RepID=UPI0036348E6C